MITREDQKVLSDEEVAGAAGGFLEKTQWEDYLSTQVMPILWGLISGASESDKSILNTICKTLQDTTNRGGNVSDAITNLWVTYNTVSRPSLQSSKIRATLDQKLYSARRYAEDHR